jgi:hypothetical protein
MFATNFKEKMIKVLMKLAMFSNLGNLKPTDFDGKIVADVGQFFRQIAVNCPFSATMSISRQFLGN